MAVDIEKFGSDLSLLKELKKDSLAFEEPFNKLSLKRQLDLFMNADDKSRLALVEISHKPRELLAGVPATELWLTIKRLTPEDSGSLIKYSTPEQLQVICDIECWQKDHLENESIYEWVGHILSSGADKLMEWFREGDWDQILWFFRENIVVLKKESNDVDPADAVSWPREEAPITHEGVYYFQVVNEKYDQLLRRVLEFLVKNDFDMYHKILEAAIWDIQSQRQEDAFEIKSRRLAEHGIPPFDEAIGIYSPLNPKKLKMVEKRKCGGEKSFAVRYPLMVMGDRVLFVNRVFAEFSGELESAFLSETAIIANKILIADGLDVSEINLTRALAKAVGYTNIGLEFLSNGDVSEGVRLINEYWLHTIFQVGLFEVMKLSRETKKVFAESWMRGSRENLSLLEPDQKTVIENLLSKRPIYGADVDELGLGEVRDFASEQEIAAVKNAVAEAVFIGTMIENNFIKPVQNIREIVASWDDLRFTGLISTAMVNGMISGSYTFKPVSPEDFKYFLGKIDLSRKESMLAKLYDELKKWITSKEGRLAQEEEKYLGSLVDAASERFTDEFKNLKDPPEPKYIQSVWIS